MLVRRINFSGYDLDIPKLLQRRLANAPLPMELDGEQMIFSLEHEDELDQLCQALSLLLCRDLMHFELAQLVDRLPLPVMEKQSVLADAIAIAKSGERAMTARRILKDYLSSQNLLHIEGFLRFRLPDTRALWQRAVEQAAKEQALRQEYLELMGVLRAFVQLQPPQIREISLCLNPDGSCTLTDASDTRVEYAACPQDQLVSLLVSIAPARLTVYDLSGGQRDALTEALSRVFAGRVRFYR